MRYLTADLHLGHRRILDYCPNRVYPSVEAMDEAIIASWNGVVSAEDSVWVLGDFALCGKTYMKSVIARLRGHKMLVLGNHDRCKRGWYERAGFERVLVSTAENPVYWWASELGTKLWISHYPFRPSWGEIVCYALSNWKALRFLGRMIPEDQNWILHGHAHNMWRTRRRQFNVGWDIHSRPVSEAEVVAEIRGRENGG
jgi:calcineurin-like phosphoesterase family protein